MCDKIVVKLGSILNSNGSNSIDFKKDFSQHFAITEEEDLYMSKEFSNYFLNHIKNYSKYINEDITDNILTKSDKPLNETFTEVSSKANSNEYSQDYTDITDSQIFFKYYKSILTKSQRITEISKINVDLSSSSLKSINKNITTDITYISGTSHTYNIILPYYFGYNLTSSSVINQSTLVLTFPIRSFFTKQHNSILQSSDDFKNKSIFNKVLCNMPEGANNIVPTYISVSKDNVKGKRNLRFDLEEEKLKKISKKYIVIININFFVVNVELFWSLRLVNNIIMNSFNFERHIYSGIDLIAKNVHYIQHKTCNLACLKNYKQVTYFAFESLYLQYLSSTQLDCKTLKRIFFSKFYMPLEIRINLEEDNNNYLYNINILHKLLLNNTIEHFTINMKTEKEKAKIIHYFADNMILNVSYFSGKININSYFRVTIPIYINELLPTVYSMIDNLQYWLCSIMKLCEVDDDNIDRMTEFLRVIPKVFLNNLPDFVYYLIGIDVIKLMQHMINQYTSKTICNSTIIFKYACRVWRHRKMQSALKSICSHIACSHEKFRKDEVYQVMKDDDVYNMIVEKNQKNKQKNKGYSNKWNSIYDIDPLLMKYTCIYQSLITINFIELMGTRIECYNLLTKLLITMMKEHRLFNMDYANELFIPILKHDWDPAVLKQISDMLRHIAGEMTMFSGNLHDNMDNTEDADAGAKSILFMDMMADLCREGDFF